MKRIIIKNGTIIDGSGNDRYAADLVLKNGRICQIVRRTEMSKEPESIAHQKIEDQFLGHRRGNPRPFNDRVIHIVTEGSTSMYSV